MGLNGAGIKMSLGIATQVIGSPLVVLLTVRNSLGWDWGSAVSRYLKKRRISNVQAGKHDLKAPIKVLHIGYAERDSGVGRVIAEVACEI